MIALVANAYAQAVTGGALPELDAQRFRPTVNGVKTLWTDDALRAPSDTASVRLLAHYASQPLLWLGADGTEIELVSDVLQTDLMGTYSAGRLRVGGALPVIVLTNGDATGQESGLGDVSLDARVIAVDGAAPLDFALAGRLHLPTNTVDTALGSPSFGGELSAIADKEIGKGLLAANLGARLGPRTELENVSLDDAFLFRVAAAYGAAEKVGVALEANGELSFSDLGNTASAPVELLVSGWGVPAGAWAFRWGAGAGLTGGVGSPDWRAVLGLAYEPRGAVRVVGDADGDGLLDNVDTCPTVPEDLDRWQDEDGCPDPDDDADGVLDVDDACVRVAEDRDAWQDDDGCPDPTTRLTVRLVDLANEPIGVARLGLTGPGTELKSVGAEYTVELAPGEYRAAATAGAYLPAEQALVVLDGPPQVVTLMMSPQPDVQVVVTRDRIDLKEKIYFETNSATIKPISFALLNQAAQILLDYPEIRVLRIEGHTDSRGPDAYNLDLSGKRAASVLDYLVSRGVAWERLKSEGFGETKPLDPAENEGAWSLNRRVDLFVEEWRE